MDQGLLSPRLTPHPFQSAASWTKIWRMAQNERSSKHQTPANVIRCLHANIDMSAQAMLPENFKQKYSQVLCSPINHEIPITIIITGWILFRAMPLASDLRLFTLSAGSSRLQLQFLLLQHFHFLPIHPEQKVNSKTLEI